MNSVIQKISRRTVRISLIAIAIACVALGLFMFLASLGDSDLPPYIPDTAAERIGKVTCGLALWPLTATAIALGHDPPAIFWLPAALLGGLSWALVFELFLTGLRSSRRKT